MFNAPPEDEQRRNRVVVYVTDSQLEDMNNIATELGMKRSELLFYIWEDFVSVGEEPADDGRTKAHPAETHQRTIL